jgi:hypothetical protein
MRHPALSAILIFLLVPPAQAQDIPVTAEQGTLALSAHGQVLHMPAPDWLAPEQLNNPDMLDAVSSAYQPEASRARLTMSPQGERAGAWSTLYTAEIIGGAQSGLAVQRQSLMNRLAATCKPEERTFFLLGEATTDTFPPLGFVCGHYIEGGALPAGQGEVMISVFKRTETGAALLMQQWRGPAFDPAQSSSWPVPADTVEARAEAFEAATLESAD